MTNHLQPGKIRTNMLRAVFALNAVGLGPGVWQAIIRPTDPWAYYDGVAMSFWAALSLLALLGVLFPLRMLPLLLLQLTYKAIWLVGVGLPLSLHGPMSEAALDLMKANGIGVVLLTLVLPWRYLATQYFKNPARPQVATA